MLNATGRTVTPGFIDMHSHSDWRLWGNRRAESKIRQGVTTEVVGNCGFSPAPVATEFLEDLRAFALYIPTGMDFAWRSVGEYLQAFDRDGTALNVVQLVGHGTLRIAAMGFARRPPTGAELTQMQRIMGDAMDEGAWGLSTGLIYAPGSWATTEEIIAVAKAAARYRGFYASHIRGEGATLLDAVRRGDPGRARGDPAGAGEPHQGGRAPELGQGRRRAGADRRGPRRGARRDGRRLSVHRVEHVAAHRCCPTGRWRAASTGMLKRLADPGARAQIRARAGGPGERAEPHRAGWAGRTS